MKWDQAPDAIFNERLIKILFGMRLSFQAEASELLGNELNDAINWKENASVLL